MFAIVEFPLSKEVEPVPKNWITKDGQCWWPKYKSISKIRLAIVQQEVPNKDNYTSYPARVLKYYATYDAAAADAPRAQFDSDLNSEPDSTPKSRHPRLRPPKRTIEMSSDEEDDLNHIPAPPPPPPLLLPSPPFPILPEKTNENKRRREFGRTKSTPGAPLSLFLETGNQNEVETGESVPSHILGLVSLDTFGTNNIEPPPRPPSAVSTNAGSTDAHSSLTTSQNVDGNSFTDATMSTANFQSWVVRHMGILKAQVSQLQESVDVLIHGQKIGQANPQNVENEDLPSLPIHNMNELESLNEVLAVDVKRKALVTKLARRGGQTLGDCVRRILQILLSNEFAKNFNWIGSRGDKMGFKNTSLINIVYDAVRSNRRMDNADEKLMEIAIKDWLKNAKKRSDKDNLRHQPMDSQ